MSDGRRTAGGLVACCALALGVLGLAPAVAATSSVSLSGVSPSAVATGATRDVTITGSGFDLGAVSVTVSGSGVNVADVVVRSGSTVTASLAAAAGAASGPRDLSVEVGDAGTATLEGAVRVVPAPTLASVTPGQVARGGPAVRLELRGTGFARGLRVSIDGSSATSERASVRSSTRASVLVRFGAGAALGAHTTILENPDGGYDTVTTMPVVDAPPGAASLSVGQLDEDETTPATIEGHGFSPGATVRLGPDVVATVTAVTSSQLSVTLHASARAAVGRRTLTVREPDGATTVLHDALRVGYQPILARWAVGDGAVGWSTTLRRPTFAAAPTISFSGTGVTTTSTLDASGHLDVAFTVASSAAATWRTMTLTEGSTSWVVPRGLKVRVPPVITSFPSLAQGSSYETVEVRGRNFEVCAERDPSVSVSGTGVTVNLASPALGNLMYVNVSVADDAATGPRDVTMTNCDSGGTSTSVGVFSVTAG